MLRSDICKTNHFHFRKHTSDWTCQSGVKSAGLLLSPLLLRSRLVAEFSRVLQAIEGIQHECILRVPVGKPNHIQERIFGYAAVAWVGNGRTNKPDRSPV